MPGLTILYREGQGMRARGPLLEPAALLVVEEVLNARAAKRVGRLAKNGRVSLIVAGEPIPEMGRPPRQIP